MNSHILKSLLVAAFVALEFAPSQGQIVNQTFQIDPRLEQAINNRDAPQFAAEVRELLNSMRSESERATQTILAAIRTLNVPEKRNEMLPMLFQLPVKEDALNITHTLLLTRLYLQSALSPFPQQPRRRSFIDDATLQSRLLDILGSLLSAESERARISAGEPIPRLLQLFEAARSLNTVPEEYSPILDESVRTVQKVVIDRELKNDEASANSDVPLPQALTAPLAATPAPSTPVPTATPAPSSPASTVAENAAPVIERESSAWPWLVGIAAFIVIVTVALKRRA